MQTKSAGNRIGVLLFVGLLAIGATARAQATASDQCGYHCSNRTVSHRHQYRPLRSLRRPLRLLTGKGVCRGLSTPLSMGNSKALLGHRAQVGLISSILIAQVRWWL